MKPPTQGGDWSKAGLDALRFVLALTVVIGHLTQPFFQNTWRDVTGMTVMAVGGFFVLSGYTICLLTDRSPGFDIASYFVERASRLLSVSVFALVLTVIADMTSAQLAPDYYSEHFAQTWDMALPSILINLVFMSQLWGYDFSPLSNSPFWSLSYEAGFYAIWAVYMHWRMASGSVIWVLAALAFFGPNIVSMLPFWLLGVVLYKIGRLPLRRQWVLTAIIVATGVLFIVGARVTAASPTLLFYGGVKWIEGTIHHALHLLNVVPARVNYAVMVGAMLSFALLIPAIAFAQWLNGVAALPNGVSKALARLGDLTFPLYLIHFPLLVLARAAELYDPNSASDKWLLVLALVALALVCTKITDPFKWWMRKTLRWTLGRAGKQQAA